MTKPFGNWVSILLPIDEDDQIDFVRLEEKLNMGLMVFIQMERQVDFIISREKSLIR